MNAITITVECRINDYDRECSFFEEPKKWISFGWCRKKCIHEIYGECKNDNAIKEALKGFK